MHDILGFEPEYTTKQAFEAFVEARNLNKVLAPDRLLAVENTLSQILTRGAA
jgi:hypothetical protein